MTQKTNRSGIARRLDGVSESATLKLNAMVQQMKAQGVDVINLTAGEPDFPPLEAAKEGVIEAVRANRSKYTPAAGLPEFRELIAAKTNRQQPGLAQKWTAKDVVVTNGGKQALFNAILALIDPGDEVLIPTPYWLSYPEMVKIAGGIPKFIPSTHEKGFKISPEQLKAAIGPKVKALVLNSPSNPSGAMYSEAEFRALARVLEELPENDRIWVLSDEIYDTITFGDEPFCSFLKAAPGLRDRVITVNGLSKSGAMTGWRIGWSVATPKITEALGTLQGQSTSGICALSQWAGIAVMKRPESEFLELAKPFHRRRALALEILRKAAKIKVFAPQGSFYFFVGIGSYLKPGEDSFGFSERLLSQGRVAVVPGTPFGDPEGVRVSFATDDRSLEEGCRRLVGFLGS
jgi:aspartate aminotransferase